MVNSSQQRTRPYYPKRHHLRVNETPVVYSFTNVQLHCMNFRFDPSNCLFEKSFVFDSEIFGVGDGIQTIDEP